MLNPDGAKTYTRENANKVDLNRDSQDLTQPESKILRKLTTPLVLIIAIAYMISVLSLG
jgi:murein tripeptide amidase MpaA